MMQIRLGSVIGSVLLGGCSSAPVGDRVRSLPGFDDDSWLSSFEAYSGFLDVPGPVCGYDALRIHYQFHTSQRSAASDPVAVWHQGGPGGSSMFGLYGEGGAFVIGESGSYINPWAWNREANMLYLESPAGSGGTSGFSQCLKAGEVVGCAWDDRTQGEAYAHTLQAFFSVFPEFAGRDLYMAGESYFGIYGPIIADYVLNTEPFKSSINLKGLAVGNAAWGGNETCISVNGPSEDKIDVDLFFGHGFFSPKLHEQIYAECAFPTTYTDCSDPNNEDPAGHAALSQECRTLLDTMRTEVGPVDVYNIYDNCPQTQKFFERTGKNASWLASTLRRRMHDPAAANEALLDLNGGFQWDCRGDWSQWILSPEVRQALHLDASEPGASTFDYVLSGPAAVTLYPTLVSKLRMLVYSGDADACVPTAGTEQWIQALEDQGHIEESAPWSPWFAGDARDAPSGYATKYDVPGSDMDFSFVTVRLAGHLVPQVKPEEAFVMWSRFLAGADWSGSGAEGSAATLV